MRALVTGSFGFLGSNLVKRLKADGHKVIGWDIRGGGEDVCDPNLTLAGVDAIFHLACPVNPADYKSVALETIRASSQGTLNMLNLAIKNNARFLYVSSSEVYGDIYDHPFKEEDTVSVNSFQERSFYDISKLFGEVVTFNYHRYRGLNVRIIRPFNVYGPGMRSDDTRVIPSFIRRAKEGKPVQITGKGDATRTFCYVDDFIDGVVRAMWKPHTNGEIFNLGTTKLVTILELAKMLKAGVEFVPGRKGEQKHRKPNISKARRLLGWEPTTSLKKGLELTWQNYP